MAKTTIPLAVRRLILTSIPSVPHLEALMLMRASDPTPWSAPELAQRLYVTPAAAGDVLEYLRHAGMLDADADAAPRAYRLRPQRDRLLATLAQLYSTHLVEITILIHGRPQREGQADSGDGSSDGPCGAS